MVCTYSKTLISFRLVREWKESNLHLQISHINWNRTNDLTDNLHSIMWFDFSVYSVYSLLLDLPATLPKLYCCYICHRAINSFNLNKDSTKVQILTAFLFHSIHHVALRITLTSITCLPLQGLPTVNSVCPLGFNIGISHPSQQYKSG